MKLLSTYLAIIALAIGSLFTVLDRTNQPVTMELLQDGTYTVYSIQDMYDRDEGEPVFYVVGGKGKMDVSNNDTPLYIEPEETYLFIVPRSQFANPQDVVGKTDGNIIVKDGVATFL